MHNIIPVIIHPPLSGVGGVQEASRGEAFSSGAGLDWASLSAFYLFSLGLLREFNLRYLRNELVLSSESDGADALYSDTNSCRCTPAVPGMRGHMYVPLIDCICRCRISLTNKPRLI
jgi:hypothetical protein